MKEHATRFRKIVTAFSGSLFLFLLSSHAFAGVAKSQSGGAATEAIPEHPTAEATARIDDILSRSWEKAGITPNEPASDEVFLRRVYLDVIGRIPTYEEANAFLQSSRPDKRARLIDQLLDSEGYVNHYFNLWADILRINTSTPASQNIMPFYIDWVRGALRDNMPYDQFVRELVTATGQAWDNGAIGYYTRDRGMPLDHMANTVRIFLGTRLECAQCHDHPFDVWTQMDFFKMAAFSYGVNPSGSDYGALSKARSELRKNKGMPTQRRKDLEAAMTEVTRVVRNNYLVSHRNTLPKLPHDYQYDDAKPKSVVQPATLFGDDPKVEKWDNRIQTYAEWMTSSDNPMFTRVIANRLWTKVMGVGIYNTLDEFTEFTKASHPELIAHLEEQLVASGYDMKAYLRMILNSKVYQREATGGDLPFNGNYHFAGPVVRRMSAEQVWDSIVALVNPTPEPDDWKKDQQFELRMAEQEAMLEVLQSVDQKEMLKHARTIAAKQKDLQEEEKKLRAEIARAEKAKDSKKAGKLKREVNTMRSRLRREIVTAVFHPEMKEIGVEKLAMTTPSGKRMMVSPMMMDGNGSSSAELRKKQAEVETAIIADEMDEMGMTDPKARKQYSAFRKANFSSMLRAAHISSPAAPGHFLREFGQSDRDTIENANRDASVPQALALLNGPAFNQLANPHSVIHRSVREARTPEEKIERIYLSMYSRKPTEAEYSIILDNIEKRGSNLYADTVFALLNGAEFWFVQ